MQWIKEIPELGPRKLHFPILDSLGIQFYSNPFRKMGFAVAYEHTWFLKQLTEKEELRPILLNNKTNYTRKGISMECNKQKRLQIFMTLKMTAGLLLLEIILYFHRFPEQLILCSWYWWMKMKIVVIAVVSDENLICTFSTHYKSKIKGTLESSFP